LREKLIADDVTVSIAAAHPAGVRARRVRAVSHDGTAAVFDTAAAVALGAGVIRRLARME
jgi:hypothetical protein